MTWDYAWIPRILLLNLVQGCTCALDGPLLKSFAMGEMTWDYAWIPRSLLLNLVQGCTCALDGPLLKSFAMGEMTWDYAWIPRSLLLNLVQGCTCALDGPLLKSFAMVRNDMRLCLDSQKFTLELSTGVYMCPWWPPVKVFCYGAKWHETMPLLRQNGGIRTLFQMDRECCVPALRDWQQWEILWGEMWHRLRVRQREKCSLYHTETPLDRESKPGEGEGVLNRNLGRGVRPTQWTPDPVQDTNKKSLLPCLRERAVISYPVQDWIKHYRIQNYSNLNGT